MGLDRPSFAGGNAMQEVEELPTAESAYNKDGVDLSLIRWMLSQTPRQRLMFAQGFAQAVQKVRNAQLAAGLPGNLGRSGRARS
jgi:hypothetical protein